MDSVVKVDDEEHIKRYVNDIKNIKNVVEKLLLSKLNEFLKRKHENDDQAANQACLDPIWIGKVKHL